MSLNLDANYASWLKLVPPSVAISQACYEFDAAVLRAYEAGVALKDIARRLGRKYGNVHVAKRRAEFRRYGLNTKIAPVDTYFRTHGDVGTLGSSWVNRPPRGTVYSDQPKVKTVQHYAHVRAYFDHKWHEFGKMFVPNPCSVKKIEPMPPGCPVWKSRNSLYIGPEAPPGGDWAVVGFVE